jgi:hypothetical protein
MTISLSDFKVGSKIWVERTAHGTPRWDFNADECNGLGTDEWMVGSIFQITNEPIARASFDDDGIDHWEFPLPGHGSWDPNRPGWYRLTPPDSEDDHTSPVTVIWTETLGKPNRGSTIPDRVLAEAMDRGERKVRRMGREWPYGKALHHRQTQMSDGTFCLEFFWVDEG